jgi:hypothetical protein
LKTLQKSEKAACDREKKLLSDAVANLEKDKRNCEKEKSDLNTANSQLQKELNTANQTALKASVSEANANAVRNSAETLRSNLSSRTQERDEAQNGLREETSALAVTKGQLEECRANQGSHQQTTDQ